VSSSGQAYGSILPEDSATNYAQADAHIRYLLSRARTCIPVKVISCSNSGDLSPVGTVSVQPAVNMLDTAGNATPHAIINNVPYTRIQGGTNAVIIDPVAGDFGYCVICDRDIATFKTNKAISNPGSWRKFDFADAVYIGGILNVVPVQRVRFSSDGIDITDKNNTTVQMNSSGVNITDLSGNHIYMNSSGILINGILFPTGGSGDWATHTHSGVTTGSGDTGPPV
jgi:hypothetical protein